MSRGAQDGIPGLALERPSRLRWQQGASEPDIPGVEKMRGRTETEDSTNPAATSVGVLTLFPNEVTHTISFF